MNSDSETLQKILAGISELKSEISGLRQQVEGGFEVITGELHEVRMIQDAQGRELNRILENVDSINRKLSRLGEVLR